MPLRYCRMAYTMRCTGIVSRAVVMASARKTAIGILTGCARATIATVCYCKAAPPTVCTVLCAVQTKRLPLGTDILGATCETRPSPLARTRPACGRPSHSALMSVLPFETSLSLGESFNPSAILFLALC